MRWKHVETMGLLPSVIKVPVDFLPSAISETNSEMTAPIEGNHSFLKGSIPTPKVQAFDGSPKSIEHKGPK